MPTRTREFIIAVDDPGFEGCYASFDSEERIQNPIFHRGNGEYIGYQFVKRAPVGSGFPWVQIDPPASVMVNVGDPDTAPEGMIFQIRITNDDTTDTGTFIINAGDDVTTVTAAVNTMAGTLSLPYYDVEIIGCDYLFRSTGAGNSTFTVELNALWPDSDVSAQKLVQQSGSTRELHRVTANQKGLAWSNPSTAYADDTTDVVADLDIEGSSSQPSVQTISLDVLPIGGYASWYIVIRQLVEATTVADSGGSLNNKIVVQVEDASGPVQVVLSNGTSTGSIPTAPVGGRNIVVAFVNGDSAATVARKIYDQLASDTFVDVTALSEATVTISTSFAGFLEGDAGFAATRTRVRRGHTAILPVSASGETITTALLDYFTCEITEAGEYRFICNENGAQAAIVLDRSEFILPKGVEGELSFETESCVRRVGESGTVETTFQVRTKPSGESPRLVLSMPCTVESNINRTT